MSKGAKKGQTPRERRNRLLICHPTIELGWTRTWVSMLQINHIGQYIDSGMFVPSIGSMIVTTHNKFMREALKLKNWDYVGFFEYDHEFPRNVIERAWYYREPMVSGMYHYREKPFFPLVYYWNEDKSSVRSAGPIEFAKFLDEPGLHEVGGTPMGCVWIRRDVFEKYLVDYPGEPFFASPTNRMTDMESGDYEFHAITDDLWFSRHVLDMGFKIYVDTSVKVKHLVVTAIDERFYIAEMNMALQRAEAERGNGSQQDLPSAAQPSKLIAVRKEIEVPKLEVVTHV